MSEQFGHYILEGMLGRGGMGEVYRAYDTRRDRVVALKRLPKDLVHDETFQARFRRECRLVARLNEPHVIPIHDFGEIDGHLYLDMRLVEGVDLSTVIADDGPMNPRLAVDIIGQIGAALQAAHNSGLVHRDVKPSNILLTGLTEDRQSVFAYLVDFGIARSEGSGGGTALTATTGTVGTLGYMAPERISGGDGDSRSDVYSLACVLYECLTGHSPFKGETFQVMFAHVNVPPPIPSADRAGLPPGLDNVVRRGLAKDPAQRYQTATALAADARAALTGAGGRPPVSPPRPPFQGGAAPLTRPPGTNPPAMPNPPPMPNSLQVPNSLQLPSSLQGRPPMPPPNRPLTPPANRPPPTTPPPGRGPVSGPQPNRPVSGPVPPGGPPGRPPGRPPSMPTSTPRPPSQPPPRKGIFGDRRNLVAIAIALAAVIAAAIIVVVVTRSGGGTPSANGSGSGTSTPSGSPTDFPSTNGTSGSATSTGTGDFSSYTDFSRLIGSSPNDTTAAFKNASCTLADPTAGVTGMIDQVICRSLKDTSVVFYIGRFKTATDLNNYVNSLVTDHSYKSRYWTEDGMRRGKLYTSPSSAAYADVTSSICAMPTYLVDFYASGTSGISEATVFEDYWKPAPFPNVKPAVCGS